MGGQIQRKDYRFSELLNFQTESEQMSLDAPSDEGVFLEQSICDYRRLGEGAKDYSRMSTIPMF